MNCDRCYTSMSVYRVSYFDTAQICIKCLRDEEKHPDYEFARAAEQAAVQAGNLNFQGIGWPGQYGRVFKS